MGSSVITTAVNAESNSDEILSASLKINEEPQNLPLKISGPEPIFIKVGPDKANSFVEMSVYLATEKGKEISVSSDLTDFFVTADGAAFRTEKKGIIAFAAEDDRVQIFAYGQMPTKALTTVLKVGGDSDLLNILARSDGQMTLESDSPTPVKASQSAKSVTHDPLTSPVLSKLRSVISNSTLPNKDHYLLVSQDVESTFREGKEDEAISRALSTIDEIQDQEKTYTQNKRECERSRLKILEAEDLLSKTDLPKQVLDGATNELNHAKDYQKSFLCQEALTSAEKAAKSVQLDPFTWITTMYPWLMPAIIVVGLGFVGLVLVQRYRAATLVGGLR
jgi:hypothetical protein